MKMDQSRPKLTSFRVTKIKSENQASSGGEDAWSIEFNQNIEVGLASTNNQNSETLFAIVIVEFTAKATQEKLPGQYAQFNASYEAKFQYPSNTNQTAIQLELASQQYQYILVAQVFPLAITHFRREMQSMGFDARELPLGI
jgi:hypothetical protein